MRASRRLKRLMDSGRTVFSIQDLRILWDDRAHTVRMNAVRMTDQRLIFRLARGYYALSEKYNKYELANRIVSPSYVSFQSALFFAGVCFQERGEIDSAARFNYHKVIDDHTYVYYSLKDELLFNIEGIYWRDGVSIASAERAILDCLYLGFLPDIDRREKIDGSFLKRLSAAYPKVVREKVARLL